MTMVIHHSFPPIATSAAQVLILGSMPGRVSLAARAYYAHPRNAFWQIMGALIGAHPQLPYCERIKILKQRRIALWDVLQQCIRNGSLDTAIVTRSMKLQDFVTFFARHPQIRRVYFNGAKAAQLFQSRVLPTLTTKPLSLHRLPSTSPAYASLNATQKLAAWRCILDHELR